MTYLKIFYDWLDALERLGDAERGRLFLAIMKYGSTGELVQLGGNERVLFPMLKAQIDGDNEKAKRLSQVRSEAARSKCKQMQANASNCKQLQANDSNCYVEENKENEKEKDTQKEKDIEIKELKENTLTSAKEIRRFTKPTVEEIAEYCRERNNGINAQSFYDFYEAKGWLIGKNPMKDWRAAVRTWEQRHPKKDVGFDVNEFFELAVKRGEEI